MTLVDKSPGNAEHPNFLRVACRGWTRASFIHLFRHPAPAIHSTVELRKSIEVTQGVVGHVSEAEQFAAAEATWLEGNSNIMDVLPNEATSMISVNYEQLVVSPEATLRAVCATLSIDWEPQMLEPYDAESTKSFKAAETVFVGDFKLFKKSRIDEKQATKWRNVTMPSSLRSATIALAHELGYTDTVSWSLQLPPELVWLRPPKLHTVEPVATAYILCIHPGTGQFDLLRELMSHVRLPSLGLRLTSRSLQACESVAHLEHRYWELATSQVFRRPTFNKGLDPKSPMLVSNGNGDAPWRVLGHSFGCRIAFSFSARFEEMGCKDVRVILLDGRVVDQPFFTSRADDSLAYRLQDAIRGMFGKEAADNMSALGKLPIEGELISLYSSLLSPDVSFHPSAADFSCCAAPAAPFVQVADIP